MNRSINEAAIREVVREFESPVNCAEEIAQALELAARGLSTPHERRAILYLATELSEHCGLSKDLFGKAWAAVGFEGPAL